MPIFKSLEETIINGDTLYNFGGYIPPILFPPVPYNPEFCIGAGFAGNSSLEGTYGVDLSVNNDKILVAGQFGWYKNNFTRNIAVLNLDGSYDTTFTSPFNNIPTSSGAINYKFRSSRRAGYTDMYMTCGAPVANYKSLSRLQADGTPDPYWYFASSGLTIYDFVELSGGSVIYIGNFTNDSGRVRINRCDPNGNQFSLWPSGGGFNGAPYSILLSPDEQYVYVCGAFTQYSGITTNRIVKLDVNFGIKNNTFQASFDNTCREMAFDSDGDLWVCGAFTNDPTGAGNNITAINCLDANTGASITGKTANIGGGFSPYNLFGIEYDAVNDRIICLNQLGNTNNYNGLTPQTYYGRICALNASDGTFDTTFGSTTDTSYGFEEQVGFDIQEDMMIDTNGNVYVNGVFTTFSDDRYDNFIRLDQNGQSNTNTNC